MVFERKLLLPLLFLISIGNCEFGHAQIHDYPKNEARGIPGQEPRSFVFGWRSVEGAQSYEYILTDNPFCFSNFGCPIRAGIVEDTFAIGFGLTEDWSYYWITRVIYQNGDTSAWSNPSSFFAQDPPDRPLITAVPNPSFNGNVQVWLDWSASNDLDRVELDVFDALGNRVTQTANYEFLNSPLRIQPIVLNKEKLPIGMYFVRARPLASDGFVLEDRWIRLVLR